jgi:hypothetical protein
MTTKRDYNTKDSQKNEDEKIVTQMLTKNEYRNGNIIM